MLPTGTKLKRSCAVAFLALTLGFGLSACGGGGDDEEPAAPVATTTPEETVTLTQADLIEQGDAICAEVNAAIGSIESSTADDTTKSDQITDIYDGLAARLTDLGTPSDGQAPTDVIAAVQDLADGSTDTTELQTAADEYGFSDCAEAPVMTSYSSGSSESGSSTGTDSGETYVPPTTETVPETTAPPVTTPPPATGGGVAPTPPPSTGGTGGSSGGSSSGGIGPG